jgi:DNA-binding transcriptional regulator YiaG
MKDLEPERYVNIHPGDVTPELIRTYRLDLGMTQMEFASVTKIAPGTIASWEVGQRPSSSGRAHLARLMRRSKPVLIARINLFKVIEGVKRGDLE